MEKITLNAIIIDKNKLEYDFVVSDGLKKYFSGKPMQIEYPISLSAVPKGVLAVPFVSCILPILWMTDAELCLPELDRDFFGCLPMVKQGYEKMFPESFFGGTVNPTKTISCAQMVSDRCGMLFSGGLDATQTLVSHFAEKPCLISIWGSDVQYDNEIGWHNVYSGIQEIAHRYSLTSVMIRSNFREFDNEGMLEQAFSKQLKDGWWHGLKHSLALLGHAAPYTYAQGLGTLYIAASNCPADGVVRCASNPSIDNYVRFAGCQVHHDGFEYSRQDKVRNIVRFSEATKNAVTLHVCWQSQTGTNCCQCEKCYRTIAALIAEGADPHAYGMHQASRTLPEMQRRVIEGRLLNPNTAISYWKHIQDQILRQKKVLRKQKEWKYIKWIAKANFVDISRNKMPIWYRLRAKMAEYKFYQVLHTIKERLR